MSKRLFHIHLTMARGESSLYYGIICPSPKCKGAGGPFVAVGTGKSICKACQRLVRGSLTNHEHRCQFKSLGAALEVIHTLRSLVASDRWIQSITIEAIPPDPPPDPKESVTRPHSEGWRGVSSDRFG